MRWWIGCAVVLACRSDDKISVDNAVPVAVITSHTGDEPVRGDAEEGFVGSVSDDTDDADSLLVTWLVDDAIVCESAAPLEDGTTTCTISVPAAESIDVRLEVRDPANALGTDALTLNIDQTHAPEVQLDEPTGMNEYYAEEPIPFSATVTDAEDEPGDLVVWFETSLAGRVDLGGRPDSSGNIAGSLTLSAGTHDLTLWAEDTDGKTGKDTVTLVVVERNDAPPEVTLTAPSGGDVLTVGDPIAYEATVTDDEDDPSDLTVWFESSLDGTIEIDPTPDSSGGIAGSIALGEGVHDLTLWAEDATGQTGSDTVTVTVDAIDDHPPTAIIVLPLTGGVFYTDQLIEFVGQGRDTEDATTDLLAQWDSSLDGVLADDATVDGDGIVESYSTLTEGDHVLTLTITDTAGQEGTDSVAITVGPPNSAPDCSITNPDDGEAVAVGALILFEATASDADVPSDWLTADWSSDEDGALGTSTISTDGDTVLPIDTLSANTHTITLTISDEVGTTCTDIVVVTVSSPPSVSVTEPADGATVDEGDRVTFTANVADAEDPAAELVVAWVSSLDGILSSGAPDSSGRSSFVADPLSIGTHTVTVTVTDTHGFYASAVQSLSVNGAPSAPSLVFSPTAPQTADDFTAIIASPSDDPEGDIVTYRYAWQRNGVAVAETSDTVSAAETAKDETWTVTVTPNDGRMDGPAGSASLTIANTAPGAPVVRIDEGSDAMSLGFDGVDDKVDAGTIGLSGNAPRTLMVWAYLESGASGSVNLLTLGDGTEYRRRFSLFLRSDRRVAVIGEGYDADSDTFFPLNEWTHYAATHDGAELRIYINGEEIHRDARDYDTDGAQPLIIGSNSLTRDDEFWRGQLSDAKIWARALSASDIASEMAAGIVTDATDLVGYWPLDDGAGSTATDESGYDRHGAITGGDWVEVDPFTDTPGLICVIDEPSNDADGDAVSYAFAWQVDGTLFTDTETTTFAGDTVPGDAIGIDEDWTCTVTPSDGDDLGPSASDDLSTGDPCIVARYDFDEGSGTTATDSSGNGLDGSIVGASWATGVVGSALDFSGGGSWVDLGNDPAFDIEADISIEAWIYVYGSTGDHQMVLSKWYEGGTAHQAYIMELQPDGVSLQMALKDVSPDSVPGLPYHTDPIPWGEWVHVAATYDGTTERIYVNGIEDTAFEASGPLRITSAKVFIGAHDSSGDRNGWNGLIDELRLYCRALSAEEVESHATIE
jgi:hypothetical protein